MNPGLYGTARANYTRYSRTDFTNLISSYNTYNTTSPDGDPVYGSMNDYYKDMSNNNFSLVAQVANLDSAGYPRWVNMGTIKRYYMKPASGNEKQIWYDAISYLNAQQGVSLSADQNTKVVVIYAGNMYGTPEYAKDSSGLNPRLINDGYQDAGYVMSERAMVQSRGPFSENEATFAHIGAHCHEFGHVLGLFDYYRLTNEWHKYWTLMSQGNDKGSSGQRGNCPAPMSAIDRNDLGWLNYTVVTGNNPNYQMPYSMNSAFQIGSPKILTDPRINYSQQTYYVIENRQINNGDWNRFLPNSGLLIWRYLKANTGQPGYNMYLLRANGQKFNADHDASDPFPGSLNVTRITDFTTGTDSKHLKKFCYPGPPPSNDPIEVIEWLNSNVRLGNIRSSGTTMIADISTYWHGTLSESQTWNGEVIIGEDLTIPCGLTLTIIPGTTLKFASGVKLYVYGTLNATGNSGSRISFTNSVSTEYWGGIVFNGSGANNSILSYCDISRVQTGGGSALSFYSTSGPKVSYCNISNNGSSGSKAIYLNSSTVKIYKNKLENNTYGVYGTYSTSDFGDFNIYQAGLSNNKITCNGYGISANYNSYYTVEGAAPDCGYNNISGNTTANAQVTNNSYIDATENYWGSCPATRLQTDGTGFIAAQQCLSTPPALPFLKIMSASPKSGKTEIAEINNSVLDINDDLKKAKELRLKGKYDDAFALFKYVLETSKDMNHHNQAMNGLLSIYGIEGSKEILVYLGNLSNNLKKAGFENTFADFAYANALMLNQKYDEAISQLDNIAKSYSKSYHEAMAKIQKAYICYFSKGNKEEADGILTDLEQNWKEDENVKQLKSIISKQVVPQVFKKEGIGSESYSENKIISFSLSNYPNPFNPSTTIRYSIPQDLHVKLKVYDITGKEVAVLVNEMKQAGEYNVEFNAGKYASGVYYYKLEAGSYKNIQKMVLVK